ncbi:hypothetical protein BUH_2186 [Burkholderia pseudomallei Pakistan 9]|nr:hypothetical protein BUH_2186 [Burkholderia pseudomallei Pakistan 9]
MALRCAVRRASNSLEFMSFISAKPARQTWTKTPAKAAETAAFAPYPRKRAP